MYNAPLVSVYITNFNYGRFIRQSIESVLNQTFKDFELFIIDDGSTDSSHEIIESYSDNPIVNIIYQKNRGLNISNNIALRVANGKYIMRLDADDFLRDDALESMVEKLESDPNIGLIFPDYFLVDENGHTIGEVKRHDFSKDVSLFDLPAHGACTLIRTSFLKSVGGYDEAYTCQDGYELWIKFISHFTVENINKPLFYYRQHGNNLTRKEDKILKTRIKIKDSFVEKMALNTPKTIAIIPIRRTVVGGSELALTDINGQNLLERLVSSAHSAKRISQVIVTSSSQEVESYCQTLLKEFPRLLFIPRPSELERINESLIKTYIAALQHDKVSSQHPEAILSLTLEYPFITPEILDDAVNTLTIFKADSLISVRPDYGLYYRHNGSGMVSILDQNQFTKLEREAIYKAVGGIVLSRVENVTNGKILGDKVGHIVLDQLSSLGIFSEFDLQIASLLTRDEKNITTQ